jgi:NAD(P)-dependent dehydrogenase (short-subunit alcohol dehydrogenase family)
MDLRGKAIIVTGASEGIGRSTSLALAAAGARVVAAARNGQRLEDLVATIERAMRRAAPQ